jgi:hypothetical protein
MFLKFKRKTGRYFKTGINWSVYLTAPGKNQATQ